MTPTFNANGSVLTLSMLRRFIGEVGSQRVKRWRTHPSVRYGIRADKTYLLAAPAVPQAPMPAWTIAGRPVVEKFTAPKDKLQALDGGYRVIGEIVGIGDSFHVE